MEIKKVIQSFSQPPRVAGVIYWILLWNRNSGRNFSKERWKWPMIGNSLLGTFVLPDVKNLQKLVLNSTLVFLKKGKKNLLPPSWGKNCKRSYVSSICLNKLFLNLIFKTVQKIWNLLGTLLDFCLSVSILAVDQRLQYYLLLNVYKNRIAIMWRSHLEVLF